MKQHRFSVIALALAMLLVVGGCGEPSDTTGQAHAAPPIESIELTWTRTGGFAGVDITVEMSESGKWKMIDANQDEPSVGELDAEERKELKSLVTDDELRVANQSSGDADCADAFTDRLEFDGLALETDCGAPPNSAFADIVQMLSQVTGV